MGYLFTEISVVPLSQNRYRNTFTSKQSKVTYFQHLHRCSRTAFEYSNQQECIVLNFSFTCLLVETSEQLGNAVLQRFRQIHFNVLALMDFLMIFCFLKQLCTWPRKCTQVWGRTGLLKAWGTFLSQVNYFIPADFC